MQHYATASNTAALRSNTLQLPYDQQVVEKVFLPSLRAKRSNLGFKKINNFEIATSQKSLLAMTQEGFFNNLLAG